MHDSRPRLRADDLPANPKNALGNTAADGARFASTSEERTISPRNEIALQNTVPNGDRFAPTFESERYPHETIIALANYVDQTHN